MLAPVRASGRNGVGEDVLSRYERITFEKERVNLLKSLAAFICPGHPLLDAVIDLTLSAIGTF